MAASAGISADFRAVEVEYILKFSRSKAYICVRGANGFDFMAMVDKIRPKLPDLAIVSCVGGPNDAGSTSFTKAIEQTPEIAESDCVRSDPLEVMRMCFTSGTTGNPKGVLHCSNTTVSGNRLRNERFEVSTEDVMLCFLPVGLNWGCMTVISSVMAGSKVVLMEKFSPRAVLQTIEREWVSWFNHHRLLEPIGYIPPAEAEENYYRQLASQAVMSV